MYTLGRSAASSDVMCCAVSPAVAVRAAIHVLCSSPTVQQYITSTCNIEYVHRAQSSGSVGSTY